MKNDEVKIYRYNDDICFRQCSIANKVDCRNYGDCTNFHEQTKDWETFYECNQYGIHLHCSKHPEQELIVYRDTINGCSLKCPRCNKHMEIENLDFLMKDCIRILNLSKFKGAKLIRLDDWYVPEIKKKEKIKSDYWIEVDVKQDKDNDTIIILYIGKTDSNDKVQFFIKPEKLQLSSDYKDLDPAKILSKIEVTLKDRTLTQKYDD